MTNATALEFPIAPLAPPLFQFASLFFLLSALFADPLIIRFWLSLAFACLIAATLQSYVADHSLMVDTLVWLAVTGSLHWRALWSLLKEELPLKPLADADDAALFCYLHRRSGMLRSDFDRIRAIGFWRRFQAGQRICDTDEARDRLHIVLEGRASVQLRYEDIGGHSTAASAGSTAADGDAESGGAAPARPGLRLEMKSGECFDLRLLNICGVFIGFPNRFFVGECSQSLSLSRALCA